MVLLFLFIYLFAAAEIIMMDRILECVLLLSLISISYATTKPVSVRNKSIGQLVTSSLLTWENFNANEAKHQLENAIVGGEFAGADVISSS